MASIAATRGVGAKDVVRAVATLAACPARAVDPETGIVVRATADRELTFPTESPHPSWISASLIAGEPAAIWLEHTGTTSVVEAALLDSATEILRSLRFTGEESDQVVRDDLAVLLTTDDADAIGVALARLRLTPETQCRAIARPGPVAQIQVVAQRGRLVDLSPDPEHRSGRNADRIGVGSVGRADQLASSWRSACIALAFAAEGTESDPGPTVVDYDSLGLWAQLHSELPRADGGLPDVARLSQVIGATPWAGPTLEAIVSHSSLRLAAGALFTHHSTVQSRLSVLEQRLGWDLNSPLGRIRLAMALAARRYVLHEPETGRPRSASPPVVYANA